MHDIMSTMFAEVQKETQARTIGNPAAERQAFAALYGDDLPPRSFGRGRALTIVALRATLALIAGLALLAVLA